MIREYYEGLDRGSRTGLIAGAALLLVGMLLALWWVFTPSYALLFGNLKEADAADVAESLTEWKVPYRYTDGGTGIEVPEDVVYDTRMKLVSAGVPSGGHVGFELFNDADFGVTEFAQRVNYQRAMQGELERSIGALPGVEAVRVHLTIRRPGLFVGQQDGSKASVAVTMTPGEQLTPQQVAGIRNLVAAAVDGLDPSAVVVLGPGGVLQGGASGSQDGLLAQNEEQSGYEARVRERISDLLGQVFKLSDYRVSVDARLNFDQVKRVSERLVEQGDGGNGLLVRRRTSRTGGAAEGDAGKATQSNDEYDYAHGTEREEVVRAPGQVERLSIAVLVPPTLSDSEMDRLRKLITAAAGLDTARGDRLEIDALGAGERVAAVEGTPVVDPDSTWGDDAVPGLPGDSPPSVRPANTWLLAALLVGALLGILAFLVLNRSRRELRPEERDAVLARLRTWLADGGTSA